jgi:hypothetical protein
VIAASDVAFGLVALRAQEPCLINTLLHCTHLLLLLQVSVLDYQSTQLKLMPLLATAYCLHFAKDHLVNLYCDMKRTKDALLIEEVHSLR